MSIQLAATNDGWYSVGTEKADYEIFISGCGRIDIFRTRNGTAHTRQKIAKSFWSWDEVATNYKWLAPHIAAVQTFIANCLGKQPDTKEYNNLLNLVEEGKARFIERGYADIPHKILYKGFVSAWVIKGCMAIKLDTYRFKN